MTDKRKKAECNGEGIKGLKRSARPAEEPEDTVIIPCFNAITFYGKEKENVRNGERREESR